ncbi:hypothetical protein L596_026382 [Steinernema carpocapsae]|nr:hypothetical protein L596_026382 [Steinernema carpocapsae]
MAGPSRMPLGSGQLLEPAMLDDIAKQVDATANLDDGVKDALICYVDEYIQLIIEKSADIARHRGSRRIEHRDVAFVLKNFFDMGDLAAQSLAAADEHLNPPNVEDVINGVGLGQQAAANRPNMNAHNQRVALIKKTLKKP